MAVRLQESCWVAWRSWSCWDYWSAAVEECARERKLGDYGLSTAWMLYQSFRARTSRFRRCQVLSRHLASALRRDTVEAIPLFTLGKYSHTYAHLENHTYVLEGTLFRCHSPPFSTGRRAAPSKIPKFIGALQLFPPSPWPDCSMSFPDSGGPSRLASSDQLPRSTVTILNELSCSCISWRIRTM